MERHKKSSVEGQELKDHIIEFCEAQGADLVGFAPVERWDDAGGGAARFPSPGPLATGPDRYRDRP